MQPLGMAKMISLLLAVVQLPFVLGLPAGDAEREPSQLEERAVLVASDAQPTISYSTAIESLQSATITVLPSITGVCVVGITLLQ
jgi:endo-1,3(4)-beta-glucanase